MKPLQFSLRRLLASITLIAVGLAMATRVFTAFFHWGSGVDYWIRIPLWLVSGTMIGAGLLAPFRRTMLGAVIGLAVQGVVLLALVLLFANLRQPH